tara:strand:+ start:452 stop:673 length:222 start_codon:yes stop_codon:yes gene_type:complete
VTLYFLSNIRKYQIGSKLPTYSPAVNPVPLEDFHATLLHLLGFEHKKLVYPLQGLNRRLTGIKKAKVIQDILA